MKSHDDKLKSDLAASTIDELDCVTSTQVLCEMANVFTRKFQVPGEQIIQFVDAVSQTCDVMVTDAIAVKKAVLLKERYDFSFYDSLIIAAAFTSGCEYLLSEDLSDGQVIDDMLKIINVFAHPEFLSHT